MRLAILLTLSIYISISTDSYLLPQAQSLREKDFIDYQQQPLVGVARRDHFNFRQLEGVVGRRAIARPPVEEFHGQGDDFYFPQSKRDGPKRQLAYLMSPLSDQVFEVGEALSDGTNANSILNNLFEDRYKQVGSSEWAKLLLTNLQSRNRLLANQPPADRDNECHTIRSLVELNKDDIDKKTGLVLKNCRGSVELNRCDGSCLSRVQPSIKSPGGFKKECTCCNEGNFRKIQVRLPDCHATNDGQQQQQVAGYMDIEVEEPIDCKCRDCVSHLS